MDKSLQKQLQTNALKCFRRLEMLHDLNYGCMHVLATLIRMPSIPGLICVIIPSAAHVHKAAFVNVHIYHC